MSHTAEMKQKATSIMEECVVYGFIRNIEETIKPRIVPTTITNVCLQFFYEYDCFVKSGEAMEINKDGTKVTNIEPDHEQTGASCYGTLIIGRNEKSLQFVYHWRFKIYGSTDITVSQIGTINIGIVSVKNQCLNSFYGETAGRPIHYALCSEGYTSYTFIKRNICGYGISFNRMGVLEDSSFGPGDVVDMYLDVEGRMLEYVVNGTVSLQYTKVIFCDDIFADGAVEYCVAVYSDEYRSAVELIGFDKIVRKGIQSSDETIKQWIDRISK